MSASINLNYVLGLIDGVLFLWALFQLIRIYYYSRSGVKNLKPKTIFHFIIAIAMLAYGCLLLFWIELYTRFSKPYVTSRDFWRKWRPFIIIFNVLLVSLTVTWIVVLVVWAKPNNYRMNIVEQISEGFVSCCFLVAGFGFFLFGILLFLAIRRLGSLSSPSPKTSLLSAPAPPESIRAAVVGSICTICFCIRSSVMMFSIRVAAVDPDSATTPTFAFGWEFELAYFFITEILPTMMMLFRMRKMKRRYKGSSAESRYISQSINQSSSSNGPQYHALVYNNSDSELSDESTHSDASSLSSSPNAITSPFDNRDYISN
ncbi:hypothetical protein PPL_07237 [Heterostelium album PN500]|uniref:THH1/TOM1/TOM3 domain-containing protein n=1 Tax=Heterostelium pallidum (strain ATCC 26659 / Pp 5 / PN500) TaxID=670386 RepID=D3BES2_HETP5|nr:hypothetical protein PPL_07237 [Heterostelium album PN500]EFA80403.1 hypothetical protein PPL_07237 [Heterostelium album PN500]|eukprot:XP_020432523.1 hypothetical protein PPL_07237 [Heterostelium album PN500]